VIGFDIHIAHTLLPLGISFYTFQKIALLVDVYRGEVDRPRPMGYLFFISFFPQLIAGPIVHYKEIVPQLASGIRPRLENFIAGGSLFIIGLFKKVVIADTIGESSTRFFSMVSDGTTPAFGDAWIGTLCYALQIYFDFSAYSDMALGLARTFGLDLPINFFSPYKAASIVEFWKRWHITLSRFLRDYLYFPLGGGRRGSGRRSINLMLTMLLGGLWHGAAWTYVIWGGLHGLFLLVNHLWSNSPLAQISKRWPVWRPAAHALTLACVVFAWVPFRAVGADVTFKIWHAMLGMNGIQLPSYLGDLIGRPGDVWSRFDILGPKTALVALVLLTAALVLPNSYQLMRQARLGTATPGYPATSNTERLGLQWKPNLLWACVLGLMFGLVVVKINDTSAFLYFQF
jgi:D-alanyl-lipoteichoic acid acyltransferase DltB (MBOAT superfamily)